MRSALDSYSVGGKSQEQTPFSDKRRPRKLPFFKGLSMYRNCHCNRTSHQKAEGFYKGLENALEGDDLNEQ